MSIQEAELFLSRENSSSCFHFHCIHPGLQRKMDPCSTESLSGEGESLVAQAFHSRSLEGLLFSLRRIWRRTGGVQPTGDLWACSGADSLSEGTLGGCSPELVPQAMQEAVLQHREN